MKQLIAITMLVLFATGAQAQLKQAYWRAVVDTSGVKIEVDVNNIQELTYAVRTAPTRLTTPGASLVYIALTNCVTHEALKQNDWVPATKADMFICKQQ